MKQKKRTAMISAILAAALFGLSTPFSKLLLPYIDAPYLASYLYLGAGFGMSILFLFNRKKEQHSNQLKEASLSIKDLPYVLAMILLDVAAPVLLLYGLTYASASGISLLVNFEIVATAIIALIFFREPVGKRMWGAIGLITVACIFLSLNDITNLTFSLGSILALAACICWGIENNCTKQLASKNPIQIVMIKGFGSGIGAFVLALLITDIQIFLIPIIFALLLGFIAYGLSIYFYIKAQRTLGAAITSSYYAAAPFLGAILSFVILKETLGVSFLIGLVLMIVGSYLSMSNAHAHFHAHLAETHDHRHSHDDDHHYHCHDEEIDGEHSHCHTHDFLEHDHEHTPDIEHKHNH